jgi:BCD family chlorophyll transporter-like MFS transporter
MPLRKTFQLGLIHVAVALTLVPISSTLNRIMISELGLSATLVALLISLPYLCSPIQIWLGGYSDRYPLLGFRRTPYILLGLLLCAGGAALTPTAAFLLAEGPRTGSWGPGLLAGVLAFGGWGMGFNFATVSYLSLATELAGEKQRARTVGVMWFMLIVSVIVAGVVTSLALEPYSDAALFRVFYFVCSTALALGMIGLIGLEVRGAPMAVSERRSFAVMVQALVGNPQARLFFVYLVVLLVALLGQDALLEPYAADVFGVPPGQTTRYVSIWGVALLIALLIAGSLTRRIGKMRAAAIGAIIACVGLLMIAGSGLLHQSALLIPGLVVFGFGSGLSTATNLALMLDMTMPGQVGLFIGGWGMADAFARLCGALLSGVVRDAVLAVSGNPALSYVTVFLIEALALAISLILLRRISVLRFRTGKALTVGEMATLMGETS